MTSKHDRPILRRGALEGRMRPGFEHGCSPWVFQRNIDHVNGGQDKVETSVSTLTSMQRRASHSYTCSIAGSASQTVAHC